MLILAILIIGLILRLIAITQSFWLDEAIQVLESTVPFGKVYLIPADFHPPLFHYLGWFWLKVSTVEWWARLLPVSLGLGCIYFLYRQAKEIASQKVALVAALFLASSGFHVYYSQEFRPYILSCFLATASFYLFFKLQKSSKLLNASFILVNALGFYSLYYFPLILVGQGIVMILLYRKRLLKWLANIGISFIFFLPWLPMFIQQLSIGRGWAQSFSVWKTSVSTPLLKALPLVFVKFWLGNISTNNSLLYFLAGLMLFILTILLGWRALTKKKKQAGTVLIFVLIPIMIAFLSSFFVPTIAPKRLLLVLPQFYLFLALGISSLPKKFQKLLIALILIINISSLSAYYLNPSFQREQWRQAIGWVENKANTNSLALFEFSSPFGPWAYYQNNRIEGRAVFENGMTVSQSMPLLAENKESIFLFNYLFEMTDPDQQAAQWLLNNGYVLRFTKDFPGVGFVYEYVK